MGASQSKAARNRISQLEGQLSSTETALSSTRARLRAVEEKLEKLTKDNSDRESIINKLYEVGKLQEQVCSTKVEALKSKFNLDASRKEEEELKEQLSTRRKLEMDVEMKLQKLMEIEKQVSFMNDEVLSKKYSLEASKKEEDELREQLLAQEMFQKDVEMKLEVIMKLEKQFWDTNIELLSIKGDYEAMKKEENALKEQLQSCEKLHEEMEMKLQRVMDLEKELSFIKAEDLFVKASIEASRKHEERLKKQLSKIEMYQQDMEIKLHKVLELEKEISTCEAEALSAMTSLEDSKKEVEELKEKLSSLEKVEEAVVTLKLL